MESEDGGSIPERIFLFVWDDVGDSVAGKVASEDGKSLAPIPQHVKVGVYMGRCGNCLGFKREEFLRDGFPRLTGVGAGRLDFFPGGFWD